MWTVIIYLGLIGMFRSVIGTFGFGLYILATQTQRYRTQVLPVMLCGAVFFFLNFLALAVASQFARFPF
jgi:hypothetical protein